MKLALVIVGLIFPALLLADWQPDPDDELQVLGEATLELFRQADEEFAGKLDEAHAFAVFPKLKRSALLVGWGRGHGILVEQGEFTGYVRQRRLSIGFQFGHQTQGQVLLFEDAEILEFFKSGRTEFTPQASAHSKKPRRAKDGSFSPRVAVYSLSQSGLSIEAAVGASKYRFQPVEDKDEQVVSGTVDEGGKTAD
ncbi:MAG: hypothetical protein QNJ00_18625 [Woeseiaceae bacterium]|nr:hypothetical protein [Woeseiaceae bacterium]